MALIWDASLDIHVHTVCTSIKWDQDEKHVILKFDMHDNTECRCLADLVKLQYYNKNKFVMTNSTGASDFQ